MNLFPEQINLINDVLSSIEDKSATEELKVIWGRHSGKSQVIKELDTKCNMMVFSTSAARDRKEYPNSDVFEYSMSPGDITNHIKHLARFSKVPELIVLEDFDWCGLNGREVTWVMTALREVCTEEKIPTILMLTRYNKPSITEDLFGTEGACVKKATWEVNPNITKEMIANAFCLHEAKASRDFACQ